MNNGLRGIFYQLKQRCDDIEYITKTKKEKNFI